MTDQVTIENLTIDDVNYIVDDLPDDVQQAVRKYEEWRDRFALAQDEVSLVGAALRDLGAQIVAAVRATDEKAAEEAAEAAAEEVAEDAAEINTEVEEVVAAESTLVVDDEAS